MMTSEDEQKAIEEDFSQSWDWIQRYFHDLFDPREWWAWLMPIHNLITELRQRGYDRQFRAGQSMYSLVLSRSFKHGLRASQASLVFELLREGGMKIRYDEVGHLVSEFEVDRVEITPEIEALLARLLAQPID